MKKFKHSKVLLYAAAIILVCMVTLAISIHVAFDAEEGNVVAEQSGAIVTMPAVTEAESSTPGAQYITEEEAADIFRNAVSGAFDSTVKEAWLGITFNESGNLGDNQRAGWYLSDGTYSCNLDAISGEVLMCERTINYTGSIITVDEYLSMGDDTITGPLDMYNSPDNLFIRAGLEIIGDRFANGRTVDNAMINATQLVGIAGDKRGTVETNVDVLMATGRSYRLLFWGTDEAVFVGYYSYPTQDACLWGYFYEEDAPQYFDEWQEDPEITDGEHTDTPPSRS